MKHAHTGVRHFREGLGFCLVAIGALILGSGAIL